MTGPIDYAYFPEPELGYSDPYVERFDEKLYMTLPAYIPMEEGSFLLEEDTTASIEAFPDPLGTLVSYSCAWDHSLTVRLSEYRTADA